MKKQSTRTLETLLVSELDQWFRRHFCGLAQGMFAKDHDDPDDWATYAINPYLIGYPTRLEIWIKDKPMAAAVYLTDAAALNDISQQLPMRMAGEFITAMEDFSKYFNHTIPKYRVTTSEEDVALKRVSLLLLFQTVRTLAVRITFQLPLSPL